MTRGPEDQSRTSHRVFHCKSLDSNGPLTQHSKSEMMTIWCLLHHLVAIMSCKLFLVLVHLKSEQNWWWVPVFRSWKKSEISCFLSVSGLTWAWIQTSIPSQTMSCSLKCSSTFFTLMALSLSGTQLPGFLLWWPAPEESARWDTWFDYGMFRPKHVQ